jgi:hypothetical protein
VAGVETERLNALDAGEWIRLARGGDFEGAWRVSDRIRARTPPPSPPEVPRHLQQIWDGTPLDGRRVLIRCYHGLGDTIQFARYIPRVRSIARHVTVWVQPALQPLLQTLAAGATLLPLHDGTPEVDYDVDVEIMELPYVFRTTLDTIPAEVPYLDAPAARLPHDGRLRIGLQWRAGDWNTQRWIPFDTLEPLFALTTIRWYALQLHLQPHEHHAALDPLSPHTISATAESMRALDLVITVDSMPAHLAGALGVPVWTLLSHPADWRWLEDRTDSPWYPTMRLFRQDARGDWRQVIEDVRRNLSGRRTEFRSID